MNTYQEKMCHFINSPKFKFRTIIEDGKEYKDKKSGYVIGRIIDRIEDFTPDKDKEPAIYLSDFQEVLQVLGDQFNKIKWSAKRLTELSGEEFDFIILRQKTKFKEFSIRRE